MLADAPVRVIMRSTWEYLVLLRASLEPVAVLNGNSRELTLAHVLASTPGWVGDSRLKDLFTIASAEIDALRLLDVPQFQSLPSNSDILLPDQSIVENVFDESAYNRLIKRLEDIDSFDVKTHMRILRTTLEEMHAVRKQAEQENER